MTTPSVDTTYDEAVASVIKTVTAELRELEHEAKAITEDAAQKETAREIAEVRARLLGT